MYFDPKLTQFWMSQMRIICVAPCGIDRFQHVNPPDSVTIPQQRAPYVFTNITYVNNVIQGTSLRILKKNMYFLDSKLTQFWMSQIRMTYVPACGIDRFGHVHPPDSVTIAQQRAPYVFTNITCLISYRVQVSAFF